ncbi:MAG TPA: FlgD immunoglobulin-like domain containing protein, partial [Candidatus Eisenbacteria bacterium]|nr:FlgD immunoglobulin-like domain containing protein [Candidatus Eisenbacteria bacterium]
WGENYGAQCGNGTNVTELPPGSYTGLTNIVQMDGGRSYSMALRSDGTVYTWGRTENGELGNGVGWSNYVHSPQAINLTNVIQIEAGNTHALALLRDGTVRSWGSNFYGQLGDSTRNDRLTPSPTRFSGCIVALAAGYSHTLALRADGTVLACGNNALSSLGNGTTGGIYPFPSPVPGLTDVVAIAAAGYSSFALRSDGTVWSWGYNAFGELGNGNTTDSAVPVQVSGLSEIRQIAASYYNGYAIRNTGEAYAWGRGDMGAIGDGSAAWRLTPVVIPGLTDPKKIEAGDAGWAIALLQDGTLRAWGYNVHGVLASGAPLGAYRYSHEPVLNVTAANGVDAGFATAHVLGHLVGVTGVETPASEQVPMALALRVAPVPSRASTSLAFDLPSSGRVAIAIYDVSGRLVRSILTEPRVAGRHTTAWDGKTRSGEEAPAGVYFARLTGSGGTATRRIVLVR